MSVCYPLPSYREAKHVSLIPNENLQSPSATSPFSGELGASAQGKLSKASAALVALKSRANV